MDDDKLFQVGEYVQEFNDATGQALPCGPIYQSYGLKSHILKRHPNELDNLDHVPSIILDPDYIGKHPTEPDSIELVKVLRKCHGLYQVRSKRTLPICCKCF